MFMLKSTHRSILEAMHSHTAKRIDAYRDTINGLRADGHVLEDNLIQARGENIGLRGALEIAREANEELRAQLAERQVPAVRGSRGRFVKREG